MDPRGVCTGQKVVFSRQRWPGSCCEASNRAQTVVNAFILQLRLIAVQRFTSERRAERLQGPPIPHGKPPPSSFPPTVHAHPLHQPPPTPHAAAAPQEDAILIQMVEKIGEKRWPLIAAKLPGRTGKGCSHRWRTYLRPDVKHPHLEPFTEWEAAVIVMGQKEHANNWLCEFPRVIDRRARRARWVGRHPAAQRTARTLLPAAVSDAPPTAFGHSDPPPSSPYETHWARRHRQAPAARPQQHRRQELLALPPQGRRRAQVQLVSDRQTTDSCCTTVATPPAGIQQQAGSQHLCRPSSLHHPFPLPCSQPNNPPPHPYPHPAASSTRA
jgi:hypothetical protein